LETPPAPVAEAFVPSGRSTQRFCRSTTAGSPPRIESLALADVVEQGVHGEVGGGAGSTGAVDELLPHLESLATLVADL
jgi:hypothetical protein